MNGMRARVLCRQYWLESSLLGINLFVRGISKKRLNEVDADISSDDKESSVQAPPKTTHLTENPTYRIMLAIGLCAAYIFLLWKVTILVVNDDFVAAFIFCSKEQTS